jgi:hypothetical protein
VVGDGGNLSPEFGQRTERSGQGQGRQPAVKGNERGCQGGPLDHGESRGTACGRPGHLPSSESTVKAVGVCRLRR